MGHVQIGLVLAALLGAPAVAAPPNCEAFNQSLEQTAKALAYDADASGDDRSAIQATQRAAELSAALQQAAINLDLMKANGCPLPAWPMTSARYSRAMAECSAAAAAGRDPQGKCNRANWTPDAPN